MDSEAGSLKTEIWFVSFLGALNYETLTQRNTKYTHAKAGQSRNVLPVEPDRFLC